MIACLGNLLADTPVEMQLALDSPYLKRWTADDDNILSDSQPPADRRKPRTFACLKPGVDNTAIPLDFCFWLTRNFDGLVAAINSGRLHLFDTW